MVHLDRAHASHVVEGGQAQRQARGPGTPGAPDAVHMHLGVGRDVYIDHRLQLIDVQAARGYVSGHQHGAAAVGKLGQHLVALALLELAVQSERAYGLLLQIVHQVFALLLGIAKGQGACRAKVQQQLGDHL